MFVDRLRAREADARSLLTMKAEDLNLLQVEVIKAYDRPFPFRSIVGTDVLPQAPVDALRSAARPHRLLIGTNRDESIMFLDRATVAMPVTQHELANIDVAVARPIAAAYDTEYPQLTPLQRRVRFLSAEEYVVPSVRLANAARHNGDVWMHRFEQPAPSGPYAGWALHGSERMYAWCLFDLPLLAFTFGKAGPAERKLGNEMNERWSAFVHGGSPDIVDGPNWPRFDGARVLRLAADDVRPGVLDPDEMSLWKEIPFDLLHHDVCPSVGSEQ